MKVTGANINTKLIPGYNNPAERTYLSAKSWPFIHVDGTAGNSAVTLKYYDRSGETGELLKTEPCFTVETLDQFVFNPIRYKDAAPAADDTTAQWSATRMCYRITEPGYYVLTEDVVFGMHGQGDDSKTVDIGMPATFQAPLQVGTWTGISIESDNVVIDLNGHSLKMAPEMNNYQRFFSLIETSNRPFRMGAGGKALSGLFVDQEVIPYKNIVLKNGTLGVTSHHHIHGNFNDNILIENIKGTEFQVASIALNSATNLTIRDCSLTADGKFVNQVGEYWAQMLHLSLGLEMVIQLYAEEGPYGNAPDAEAIRNIANAYKTIVGGDDYTADDGLPQTVAGQTKIIDMLVHDFRHLINIMNPDPDTGKTIAEWNMFGVYLSNNFNTDGLPEDRSGGVSKNVLIENLKLTNLASAAVQFESPAKVPGNFAERSTQSRELLLDTVPLVAPFGYAFLLRWAFNTSSSGTKNDLYEYTEMMQFSKATPETSADEANVAYFKEAECYRPLPADPKSRFAQFAGAEKTKMLPIAEEDYFKQRFTIGGGFPNFLNHFKFSLGLALFLKKVMEPADFAASPLWAECYDVLTADNPYLMNDTLHACRLETADGENVETDGTYVVDPSAFEIVDDLCVITQRSSEHPYASRSGFRTAKDLKCFLIPGRDTRGHALKGNFGLRLDGLDGVKINRCSISNIKNHCSSPAGLSDIWNAYEMLRPEGEALGALGLALESDGTFITTGNVSPCNVTLAGGKIVGTSVVLMEDEFGSSKPEDSYVVINNEDDPLNNNFCGKLPRTGLKAPYFVESPKDLVPGEDSRNINKAQGVMALSLAACNDVEITNSSIDDIKSDFSFAIGLAVLNGTTNVRTQNLKVTNIVAGHKGENALYDSQRPNMPPTAFPVHCDASIEEVDREAVNYSL